MVKNLQLIICSIIALTGVILIMEHIPKKRVKQDHSIKIDGTFVKKDSLKLKINK